MRFKNGEPFESLIRLFGDSMGLRKWTQPKSPNTFLEVVSVAKVAAASIPFTAIVKRMLGPAADELAEMWKDQVRLYRYERQVKCVEKAEKMAQEAGFTPQAVPPKILFPLLEGASFEDNEDLHTMWAALLANAASPGNAARVRPGFIAILKQMAPDEARLLNEIYDEELLEPKSDEHESSKERGSMLFSREYLDDILESLQWNETIFEVCLERLQAELLVSVDYDSNDKELFSLTTSALSFISACRPPKPKS